MVPDLSNACAYVEAHASIADEWLGHHSLIEDCRLRYPLCSVSVWSCRKTYAYRFMAPASLIGGRHDLCLLSRLAEIILLSCGRHHGDG